MNADRARLIGLKLATELHAAIDQPRGPFDQTGPIPICVLETAGLFARWLTEPPHWLHLRPAPFTFQQPDYPGPAVRTKTGEHGMSVTMTDSQEVSYACEPEDSKGVAVSDTLTWSSDDNGAVVTLTPSADTLSCVFAAVAPGTANISVTDGTLSGTDVITVTPGGVATLVLTPGTPADEPAGP
jgi:hypothetical protein